MSGDLRVRATELPSASVRAIRHFLEVASPRRGSLPGIVS